MSLATVIDVLKTVKVPALPGSGQQAFSGGWVGVETYSIDPL